MQASTSQVPAPAAGAGAKQAAEPTLLQRLVNSDIPKTRFFQLLTSPWNPPSELTSGITSQASEDAMTMEPQTFTSRASPEANPMLLPLYRPTGAWKWAAGLGIRACTNVVHLEKDKLNSMYYGTGRIGSQGIQFICRTWPQRNNFPEFTSELGLFKSQLKPLLGTYVPNIISVYTGMGIANIVMELPHPAFWIEPSVDMPDVLKKRVIEAYEKLHEAGVLHGSPHPRNIFIGGDARVTIVNFGNARVLEPILAVKQAQATAADLRLEMRKVKYQLNFENAREKERQKWADHRQRTAWNKQEQARKVRQPGHNLQLQPEPNEDVLDPPVDTRTARSWVDSKYNAKRFIVPTISSAAFDDAVNKFIANVRRMELEEDGPPPSRSPSPPPSMSVPIQRTATEPVILPDTLSTHADKTPTPRHSPLKRKNRTDIPAFDEKRALKRHKTFADLETHFPGPSPHITVETLINEPSSSKVVIRGPSDLRSEDSMDMDASTSTLRVRDFAYELPRPKTTPLRSALKSQHTVVEVVSDSDASTLSEKARGKRKRVEDETYLQEDERTHKKMRSDDSSETSSQSSESSHKHVSFAPAPDVFLKRYTIPAHLFSKPKKRATLFKRRRTRTPIPSPGEADDDSEDDDDDEDSDTETIRERDYRQDKSTAGQEYPFTFTAKPFQYVSRWLTDILYRVRR